MVRWLQLVIQFKTMYSLWKQNLPYTSSNIRCRCC